MNKKLLKILCYAFCALAGIGLIHIIKMYITNDISFALVAMIIFIFVALGQPLFEKLS